MVRDFAKFQKWSDWNKGLQIIDFEKKKAKAIEDAKAQLAEVQIRGIKSEIRGSEYVLKKANKMEFVFDKSGLLSYGNCTKLNKEVSFIPDICQLETQNCFEHRKL
jgi:hypothetical protein